MSILERQVAPTRTGDWRTSILETQAAPARPPQHPDVAVSADAPYCWVTYENHRGVQVTLGGPNCPLTERIAEGLAQDIHATLGVPVHILMTIRTIGAV